MTNPHQSLLIEIIKVAMVHKNLSQKEFAYKIGISEAEVTRWFNGERAIPCQKLDELLSLLDLMVVSKVKLKNLLDKLFTEKDFLI